jgi:hypothetical protein
MDLDGATMVGVMAVVISVERNAKEYGDDTLARDS